MLDDLFNPIGYVFKNDMASKNIFHVAKVEKRLERKKWNLRIP
jgi:hypothetical protein